MSIEVLLLIWVAALYFALGVFDRPIAYIVARVMHGRRARRTFHRGDTAAGETFIPWDWPER